MPVKWDPMTQSVEETASNSAMSKAEHIIQYIIMLLGPQEEILVVQQCLCSSESAPTRFSYLVTLFLPAAMAIPL